MVYYVFNFDSIWCMVLFGMVWGSDLCVWFVGCDVYFVVGGWIECELFDDDDSEFWVDVVLLESFVVVKMEE